MFFFCLLVFTLTQRTNCEIRRKKKNSHYKGKKWDHLSSFPAAGSCGQSEKVTAVARDVMVHVKKAKSTNIQGWTGKWKEAWLKTSLTNHKLLKKCNNS